ncbi:uncharacterized protein LOC120936107 [Rana temporaria]|uniref:uncharacterized protein LOC120936107 n=1 Tax=Rana temporaria TaxID=8407 RepID=UPI001AAC7BDF|nr:uncharacterized protein LOC120936107 [Rana temporaria]
MAISAVLPGQTSPHRGTGEALVQISDPQESAACTSPNVYHRPDQENGFHETQMLQNGNSGQNNEREQSRRTDYGKKANLLRQIFFLQFCRQFSLKTRIICAFVVPVALVLVIVPIIVTIHKEDKGGAAANGEGGLDSRVLQSEIPGTGVTSTTTTSYGDGDHTNCDLVFINDKSKIFNDSQSYCEIGNGRLLQEKDLKAVGPCIPEGEDFWAKKGDDSNPGLCYIYNTEYNFVSLDCTTGRRCICVKDPNTTKKKEET